MAQHIGPRPGDLSAHYDKGVYIGPGGPPVRIPETTTQDLIREVCDELKDFLVAKNEQYGDSVVHPLQIFATGASADLLLRTRIDDKIKRLVEGNDSIEPDNDIVQDLLGYFIMWRVLARKHDGD